VICGNNNVAGGVAWHDGSCGEPCQCVGRAFCVGIPGPYPIRFVVEHGWPQVPTFYCVGGPCATDFRFS
jgi:hypothetical protein